MDSIRSNFLWQGAEGRFRYHMAKWEMVSRPKDQGGLSIIHTRTMNDCLLVKWIWKILQEPKDLWFKLLKAKYMDGCNFFSAPSRGSSQFWKGLHKVKHLFKWGALFQVKNGLNCHFWQDYWVLSVPLRLAYDDLFKLVRNPDSVVADCWEEGECYVDFKRALSIQEYERWTQLKRELHNISLSVEDHDVVSWGLEKKGMFTTKSLYRFILDGGGANRMAGYI